MHPAARCAQRGPREIIENERRVLNGQPCSASSHSKQEPHEKGVLRNPTPRLPGGAVSSPRSRNVMLHVESPGHCTWRCTTKCFDTVSAKILPGTKTLGPLASERRPKRYPAQGFPNWEEAIARVEVTFQPTGGKRSTLQLSLPSKHQGSACMQHPLREFALSISKQQTC